MFKKGMVLLLAVSLLIFFGSAAAASENGLFSEMIETEYSDERLAVLDEVAEPLMISLTTGSITVELSQAYYEGNRVYISYRANGPIFEDDGLTLADGSYADITAGGSVQLEDGSTIGWKECIVPEDALADPQTFCLAYKITENGEKNQINFTLEHHEYDQYLQGVSPATAYQARAILYMGKVDLKGIVMMTSPEQAASWLAWQEGEEETGTDVIACWNLYQNGELVSPDLFGATAVNGTEDIVCAVMFPWMEDLSGLSLVPEYSEAGEKPEEAIVLEPMDHE